MANPHDIIRRPILSEKSMDGVQSRHYTFEVAKSAKKTEISRAVEEAFSVEVESVRTIITLGKVKTQGKHSGRRPSVKKAIVKLKESSKGIQFFDSMV